MIRFTEQAREKIQGFLEGAGRKEDLALRVAITGQGPHGFTYEFFLDERSNVRPNDVVVRTQGLVALVDAASMKNLEGGTIDWKETVQGSGFDVDNPNQPPDPPPPVPRRQNLDTPQARRIQELIDTRINPGVASHGGFVELIDVDKERVYLKLGGGCQGCGMVNVTLKQGIEVMIKEALPQVKEVIDTTDHAGGTNPYYQPSK
ncbi:MAG: iron-sulfur cluster assembly accessory protein [Acidobacteriota bacterium]